MKKKRPFLIHCFFITGFIILLNSCNGEGIKDKSTNPDEENNTEDNSYNIPSAEGITDLVLIYHGYQERPLWNVEDLSPFIYRTTEKNKIEWQFDGLLFLEIRAEINNIRYDLAAENTWSEVPDKKVWEWLLKVNFEEGRGVKAVETILEDLAKEEHLPPYKRQVMFAIPNPIHGKNNWGIIDRQVMDFNKAEDRIIAAKWYIDQTLERWDASDFKHLDLEGFYWLHETIESKNNDGEVIIAVQQYLNSKGLNLTWIPYNWAEGTEDETWKELGFNKAYQQPNYFFKRNDGTFPELWILKRGIDHAKDIGMALEFEFDENIKDPHYLERFYAYVDEFEEGGIWENSPVAYYHGTNAWGELANSSKEEYQKAYKVLSDLLVKRQGRFSKVGKK